MMGDKGLGGQQRAPLASAALIAGNAGEHGEASAQQSAVEVTLVAFAAGGVGSREKLGWSSR